MYKRSQTFMRLEPHVCRELLRIAREEWSPNYVGNCTCGACVSEVLTYVYTQFEKEQIPEPIKPEPNERTATKARAPKKA